jgi:hypothetical protein
MTTRVLTGTRAPELSLLHATYRAGERAVGVRETWLERASRPECVEHLPPWMPVPRHRASLAAWHAASAVRKVADAAVEAVEAGAGAGARARRSGNPVAAEDAP